MLTDFPDWIAVVSYRTLVVGGVVVLIAGCAPPPLTDPGPDADGGMEAGPTGDTSEPPDTSEPSDTTEPSDTDDPSMDGMGGGDDSSAPPFSDVVSILGSNCAKSNCHGDPPTMSPNNFEMGTNSPSKTDVENALKGKMTDEGNMALVEPNKPEESAIHQALSGSDGLTQMPLGGSLSSEKTETIRAWIAGGASYD